MKNLGISLGFVRILISDFQKSAVFYRDVLGLTEDFAVEQYGWTQYNVGAASICTYVVDPNGNEGKPGVDTGMQLRVTDAKAAYELITSRGGKPGKLNTGDDGTVQFTITDPDGNKLSVAQVPTE
jgi:predicted enzyme related to lactoylglutathione lyase